MSVEQTIAELKAQAEAITEDEVDAAIQAEFWDIGLRHWFVAHTAEFRAVMGDLSAIALKNDGALSLLALYVLTRQVEHSVHTCKARQEIQAALRRMASDIADEVLPRTWTPPP